MIVDDHAFPIGSYLYVFLSKLNKFILDCDFENSKLSEIKSIYSSVENIDNDIVVLDDKHRIINYTIGDIDIWIYNYDARKSPESNQREIIKIICDESINIFWTDRGHSLAIKTGENLHGCTDKKYFQSKADLFFEKSNNIPHKIVSSLAANNVKQVAVFSFAPLILKDEIDSIRESYLKAFQEANYDIRNDNVYFLETSPVLNLFNENDILASGNDKSGFYGTVEAYKKYGQLLGSIMFDLFLQLDEYKTKLTEEQKRYNFFNRYNRSFLRYFKLLNSELVNKIENIKIKKNKTKKVAFSKSGFRIGSISFFGNILGKEHFLVDVPYKEYYKRYDDELNISVDIDSGKKRIGSLIEPPLDSYLDKWWLYFKYNKSPSGYQAFADAHKDLKSKIKLAEWYLPLLHTGIFYEPEFYSNSNFPYEKFSVNFSNTIIDESEGKNIEVIYLLKKINKDNFNQININGVVHLVLWRRVSKNSPISNFNELIDSLWGNMYRLIEPKLEASLTSLLQNETAKQAIRAAISQVMARNMSHNIGSHVMNKLIGDLRSLELLDFDEDKTSYKSSELIELHSKIVENLAKDDWYSSADKKLQDLALKNEIALKLISDFNSYVKCRMDYLADLTFGTPAMLSSKNVYTDIFEDLDRVRLLLDNISGRGEQFQYKLLFKFKDSALNKESDFPVAIPNDVLGCHAFYNIIENIIRNTAKHATNVTIPIKIFTINFREINKEEIDGNTDLMHESQSLYCVEIFDNITIGNIEPLIKSQNKKINDKILNEENKLRGESLGMIEMDASAAYLRQLEIVEVDSDDYDLDEDDKIYNSKGKLNILKAFNKEGHLAYRFFVKKPQEVLIVSDNIVDNNELIKNGVWVTDSEHFKQHLKQNRSYNHNFLVLEEGKAELRNLVGEKEAALTKRIYYKTAAEINELLKKTSEEITLTLWKCRVEELYDTYDNLDKKINSKSEIKGLPKINGKQSEFSNHLYDIADAENPKDEWKKHCENHFYYEGLSSKAQSLLPNYNKITSGITNDKLKVPTYISSIKNFRLYSPVISIQIAESILSRIIVFDERIQDKLNDMLYKIPYSKHFRMSGIIVPSKSTINLKADAIEIERLESFISRSMKWNPYGERMHPKMDFLLIHYSLLERAYENVKDKSESIELNKKDWVNRKLDEMSKKLNIVVTSGRGNIQGLPNKVRFVNLSVITTALVDIKSKYLILNILHSSRTS